MSTTQIKLPLQHAQRLANRLVELLLPHCERIDIAGSIRREKEEVGDIEIVCKPKKIAADIFGFSHKPVLEFWVKLKRFTRLMGKVDGTGRQYKYLIPTGWSEPAFIQLDLFIPATDDYFRQLAIRTGSANYSGSVIANGWRKLGWVGTEDGLRREEQVEKQGERWVCIYPDIETIKPPIWNSERDFFQWLGVEYIHPKSRI